MATMTIEEALDKLMELQNANAELTTERDALKTERDNLAASLNESRDQAMRYYLMVTQGTTEPEPEPEPVKSCEDVAREIFKDI